jgi:hypothetical protein
MHDGALDPNPSSTKINRSFRQNKRLYGSCQIGARPQIKIRTSTTRASATSEPRFLTGAARCSGEWVKGD